MTSSGSTHVRLQIVHADFCAPSGDATRGRSSLESLSGLGGAFHFARGCSERICVMSPTNSALLGSIGAPLVAATFQHGTMCDANSALSIPFLFPTEANYVEWGHLRS